VAALAAAYTAPVAVGGLLAGGLLDRFDRRRLLAADNLARGLAFATVPRGVAPTVAAVVAVMAVPAVAVAPGLVRAEVRLRDSPSR
jgi:MFS family permease